MLVHKTITLQFGFMNTLLLTTNSSAKTKISEPAASRIALYSTFMEDYNTAII